MWEFLKDFKLEKNKDFFLKMVAEAANVHIWRSPIRTPHSQY